MGQASISSPDDDQRTLSFVPNASRSNHLQASASETDRRQAVAGHGIERGQNVERAVDLRFICGSVLLPPNAELSCTAVELKKNMTSEKEIQEQQNESKAAD